MSLLVTEMTMKTDASIKNIVSAAIRRKGMNIESWVWTRLWDDGDPAIKESLSRSCSFDPGELIILYSYIDLDNWTVFTSRAVWYTNEGKRGKVLIHNIVEHKHGFFKGHKTLPIERLTILGSDGTEHHCPYHTGKTSMGPVYALDTLLLITKPRE